MHPDSIRVDVNPIEETEHNSKAEEMIEMLPQPCVKTNNDKTRREAETARQRDDHSLTWPFLCFHLVYKV